MLGQWRSALWGDYLTLQLRRFQTDDPTQLNASQKSYKGNHNNKIKVGTEQYGCTAVRTCLTFHHSEWMTK